MSTSLQQQAGQQKGAAVPGRQQQQPQQQPPPQQQPQQQQQQQQLLQLQSQAARPSSVSQAFSDPFLNTFGGGGGALAPWGGFGGGALSPFGGLGVGGEIAPLMNKALGELQRVQHLALAALPGPMRVDVVETESEYRLVADVPGVAMRDVKIDVDANNVLHISAEKANAVEQDETRVSLLRAQGATRARRPDPSLRAHAQGGVTYHRSERTSGRQWRSMQLPAYADAHKIAARIDNGVLTICAPKIEGIEVRLAPGHPAAPLRAASP